MEVRVGGRGLTLREVRRSMRSSVERSSPLTGSVWFSLMYCSIRRRSKTLPDLREATGCWGASPETARMALAAT